MRLVIIESPYAGDVETNVHYARLAMRDSLERGEAPIASHLLYTQPHILRDGDPDERQWGIDAGLAWRKVTEAAIFYTDLCWSRGMQEAHYLYLSEGVPIEYRTIFPALAAAASGGDAKQAPAESPQSGGSDSERNAQTPSPYSRR